MILSSLLGLSALTLLPTALTQESNSASSNSTPDLTCYESDALCVAIEQVDDNIARFTLRCTSGWCSVGIGSESGLMAPSTMFVLWEEEGGDVVLSQREADSRALPPVSDSNAYEVESLGRDDEGRYGGSFLVDRRQLEDPERLTVQGTSTYIYAIGSDQPSGDSFQRHTATGNFSADPATGASEAGSASLPLLVVVHGALMISAWLGLTPLGIFVARFLKGKLGVWWFRLHMALLLLVVILTIAAYILVFIVASDEHFRIGAHSYVGIVVLVACILQSGLGFIIDRLFDPKRMGIPWWDQLHWWVGRLLVLGAIVTIALGIAQSGAGVAWWIAYGLLLGLSVIGMVAGQLTMGQQHHQD